MKYAIYGGSFDPIHIGHITMAECAVSELSLERLIFVPAHISPFKQDVNVLDSADRINMIKSCLHYNSAFEVSTYETEKHITSYTINTLEYFDKTIDGMMYFLVGADSIMTMESWHRGPEILSKYKIAVSERNSITTQGFDKQIEYLKRKYNTDIYFLKMKPIDISSTDIRNRIKRGKSIDGMLKPEVEKYIFEKSLYR